MKIVTIDEIVKHFARVFISLASREAVVLDLIPAWAKAFHESLLTANLSGAFRTEAGNIAFKVESLDNLAKTQILDLIRSMSDERLAGGMFPGRPMHDLTIGEMSRVKALGQALDRLQPKLLGDRGSWDREVLN